MEHVEGVPVALGCVVLCLDDRGGVPILIARRYGVWAKLNSNVGDLLNNTGGNSGELVSNSTIFGCAVLVGLVNIVLMTTMAAIAAFVYNLSSDLVGGVEVTLADLD